MARNPAADCDIQLITHEALYGTFREHAHGAGQSTTQNAVLPLPPVQSSPRSPALASPPKTIGIPGALFLYPDRVRTVTKDGTDVEHPRRPAVGNTSYRSQDRVAKLAAVHGQQAKLYQKRREILDLGPSAEKLMTEWVHHPKLNWKCQVETLHELLIRYGPQQTPGAIERVLLHGTLHVKAITWILDKEVA